MRKYEYSNELVNLVKKFLVDDNWHFSFNENTGVFDFGLRVMSIPAPVSLLSGRRKPRFRF